MLIHKGTSMGAGLLLAVFLACSPALAQDLSLFAWLDNDHIRVQCDTAPNQPAKGATIKVFDNFSKKELASGKTDSEGRFSFRVPEAVREGHGLLLSAEAGKEGLHEWTMSAAEIYSAASLAAGFDEAALQARENGRIHIPVTRAKGTTRANPPASGQAEKSGAEAVKATAPQSQETAPKAAGPIAPADLPKELAKPAPQAPQGAAPATK